MTGVTWAVLLGFLVGQYPLRGKSSYHQDSAILIPGIGLQHNGVPYQQWQRYLAEPRTNDDDFYNDKDEENDFLRSTYVENCFDHVCDSLNPQKGYDSYEDDDDEDAEVEVHKLTNKTTIDSNTAHLYTQVKIITPNRTSDECLMNTSSVLSSGYESSQVKSSCITATFINDALRTALSQIEISTPDDYWEDEHIYPVAEVILEVTRMVAESFNLSTDDIYTKLPLIDTSGTALGSICPDYLSTVTCYKGKYRRYDGLCNNIKFTSWGASRTVYQRLLPPNYQDGLALPVHVLSSENLPAPILVSEKIHTDLAFYDSAITTMFAAWGVLLNRDISRLALPTDIEGNEPNECCWGGNPKPYCYPIDTKQSDFFTKKHIRCLESHRGLSGLRQGCRLGFHSQFNSITSVIDANFIYGESSEISKKLRTFEGGKLRVLDVFSEDKLKPLLPLRLHKADMNCMRPHKHMFGFQDGESRTNEFLPALVLSTILMRHHNAIASQLSSINKKWNDEITYQEARHIVIAQIQHITYNEFLPLLLGKEEMAKHELTLQSDFYKGYDSSINPSSTAEFSEFAFKFLMSLIPNRIERWNHQHEYIGQESLKKVLFSPFELLEPGRVDEILLGMSNQLTKAMNPGIADSLSKINRIAPHRVIAKDFVAETIQRGREMGLQSFMHYRKLCGLSTTTNWSEAVTSQIFRNESITLLSEIYKSPEDVDAFTGALCETPLKTAIVGPTLACIIGVQFSSLKKGDRFWYENFGQPSTFTKGQLDEIKKTSLFQIICENSDSIKELQVWPMTLPSSEINPRVDCKKESINRFSVTLWKE